MFQKEIFATSIAKSSKGKKGNESHKHKYREYAVENRQSRGGSRRFMYDNGFYMFTKPGEHVRDIEKCFVKQDPKGQPPHKHAIFITAPDDIVYAGAHDYFRK
jgi:hypothetical protein